MSQEKKLFVVFGATGIQGGSVARAILADPIASKQFNVRAITRDPSKPAARSLAQQGAELMKADLEDKDSLRLALKDAYAVFAVTNFWETFDAAAETRQGMNVADVAKELDVKHLIWSSLPGISRITNDRLTGVVHFDNKARVDDYIRELSIPHTIVALAIYAAFFFEILTPLPTAPPSYVLAFPEPTSAQTTVPIIDPTADLGKFVKGILLNPGKTLGQNFNVAGKEYTFEEIVSAAKGMGVDISFQPVDKETFRAGMAAKGFPNVICEGVSQAAQYIHEYGYFGGAGFEESHKVGFVGSLDYTGGNTEEQRDFVAVEKWGGCN
ncbi:hypothetical protein CBS115989_4409 [Aspergillus niger]|nr:hypothetical protein CBS115989_4409 [Aspergillus niger]KAI2849801.1 hypothetical protein CBS11232_6457 [Aspergillus niger]KAI2869556.1 hypothetical protein CBS13152_10359 [Aspergillus niger]KAI2873452.1 hypothetical protein CBS115988_7016 [Aspergillus niger]KAI3036382.1 hypothetical protein CBS76997_10021 [Aspergillus niger]